jgi:hypothetical protein
MTTPEERRQKRRDQQDREKAGQPQLRRHGPEAEAAKAFAIANSEDFKHFFETLRTEYLSELERADMDGTSENDRKALIMLAKYQALMDIKRTIFAPIVAAQRAEKREQHKQDERAKLPRRAPKEAYTNQG